MIKAVQILLVLILLPGWAHADATDQRKLEFFEKRIRPVLAEHCYQCHSTTAKKLRGELLLDSRWGWQKGGESGPPIVPGKPEESRIVKALRYESFEMPPKAKLPKTVIADLSSRNRLWRFQIAMVILNRSNRNRRESGQY